MSNKSQEQKRVLLHQACQQITGYASQTVTTVLQINFMRMVYFVSTLLFLI